jgi:membrane associated rhomboid family serine protease
MFIHGGLMHLTGNMMFLWVFGDNVEDRLGHFKYLVFYLAAGFAAALTHFATDPHSQTPMVGASGAVSGVMGAYLLLYPFNRIKALVVFYFITVVQLPAVWLLGIWFGWQLLQGLASLGISDQVNVAFFAHVGGFLAGLLLMAVYKLMKRQPLWPQRKLPPWDYWYRAGRGPG